MASEKQRAAARRNAKKKTSERDEREIQAAEAEARRVGGEVTPLSNDPAREPLEEAGEGEAEGFEQAERRLEEIAEHGDQHRFPDRDVRDPEDRESVEHGEADQPIPADE